jgi:hypothetical protein
MDNSHEVKKTKEKTLEEKIDEILMRIAEIERFIRRKD